MAWTSRGFAPSGRMAAARSVPGGAEPASRAPSPPAPVAQFSHGMPVVRLQDLARETRSTVLRVPLFSPALGLRRWLALKLPPGYVPGSKLPLVYLFRGHHFEWISPREDASRQNPLPNRFDEAVRAGTLPPAILVIPCMGSDERKMFSIATNWACPQAVSPSRGMGLGRYEDYLMQDLIPAVESALGAVEPRRIAIGFSLGGLLSMQVALRYPGFFSDVASYDGSFFDDPPQQDDSILHYGIFDPIFGYPRDLDLVQQHSPLHLVSKVPLEDLQKTRFYVRSGPQFNEPNQSNYFRCKQVIEALEARGIHNPVDQVVPDGRHDWHTADLFGMDMLGRILAS
ncbi:MAG: alpha/beta hydrolase-fold protein [Candidatus Eremiobacterota bacterium]